MEIFIRALVALGIALAVATIGFSDTPAPAAPVKGAPAAAVPAGTAPAQADCGQGWAPGIKSLGGRVAHALGCDGHGGWGAKVKAPPPPADPNQQRHKPPRTQPGTVVFPQQPFARSPRDFFMID